MLEVVLRRALPDVFDQGGDALVLQRDVEQVALCEGGAASATAARRSERASLRRQGG